MKAQRTCLVRAKNLMALSFYSFIWRYIRHKSRLPSRQATTSPARYTTLRWPSVYASLDVCSYAYKVCCTTHAWEQRVSHSSAQHAPELPHALYSANTYATTIRYSLYNAPWLPWQLSDCGRQNRDPANPKSSRSTFAKRVFIRGVARLRRTREKNALYYIKQRPLTVEANTW